MLTLPIWSGLWFTEALEQFVLTGSARVFLHKIFFLNIELWFASLSHVTFSLHRQIHSSQSPPDSGKSSSNRWENNIPVLANEPDDYCSGITPLSPPTRWCCQKQQFSSSHLVSSCHDFPNSSPPLRKFPLQINCINNFPRYTIASTWCKCSLSVKYHCVS